MPNHPSRHSPGHRADRSLGRSRVERARAIVAALALPLLVATPAFADPDCRCRAPDGDTRELGTVECVSITGNRWLVRCEMSTNTPYWRRLSDQAGCPDA